MTGASKRSSSPQYGERQQAARVRIVVQDHEAHGDRHHLDEGHHLAENQRAGDDRQEIEVEQRAGILPAY